MSNAATRSIDNVLDTARKIPTTQLAPKVLKDDEGVVLEKITGPAGAATVKLSRPAVKILHIQSFTTASGVFSTGGGKKANLTETTDYTVAKKDATGVCALTNAGATDYSAETWIVSYQPDSAEGTIGGQSTVGH